MIGDVLASVADAALDRHRHRRRGLHGGDAFADQRRLSHHLPIAQRLVCSRFRDQSLPKEDQTGQLDLDCVQKKGDVEKKGDVAAIPPQLHGSSRIGEALGSARFGGDGRWSQDVGLGDGRRCFDLQGKEQASQVDSPNPGALRRRL